MANEVNEQAAKLGYGRTRAVKGFDDLLRVVGERIRTRRQELGMKQAGLAQELGLAQNAISQYETGAVDITLCRLAQIAEVLQFEVHDLVQPPSSQEIQALLVELDHTAHSRLMYLVETAVEAKLREHIRTFHNEQARNNIANSSLGESELSQKTDMPT